MRGFDAEVIVVGAGPAGSATAFYLARAGFDVLVVDRSDFPRDKPCGEYLSPQAARILDEMGVLETLEATPSARLRGMRIAAPDGREFSGHFLAPHGFRGFRDYGLALRRTLLDEVLLRRAQAVGARFRPRVHVRDLSYAGDRVCGVVVRDDDGAGAILRAPLVIGADGLRSVVARRAGLGAHGRWPRRFAIVAHHEGVAGMGDEGEMHVWRDGYVGLAAVGGGVTNVAMVVPQSRAHGMAGDPWAFMQSHLQRDPRLRERLTGATRVTEARVVGPFNWRAKVAWQAGVALVGDAADFFDPFTGEGIYTALRGAELLVPYAAEAARPRTHHHADVALAAYDRCRRFEFRGKWQVERAIGMAVGSPLLMNHAARALASHPDRADLLVGVAGDFVPAGEVLRLGYVLGLVLAGFRGGGPRSTTGTTQEPLEGDGEKVNLVVAPDR